MQSEETLVNMCTLHGVLILLILEVSIPISLTEDKDQSVEFTDVSGTPMKNRSTGHNSNDSQSIQMSRPDTVRIVHQLVMERQVPGRYMQLAISCCPKPHWRLMVWNSQDTVDFLQSHYPWFLRIMQRARANNQRRLFHDLIRYLIIFHYGGFFLEQGSECLRPLEPLLGPFSIALSAKTWPANKLNNERRFLSSAFLYSTPRHVIWMEVIERLLANQAVYKMRKYARLRGLHLALTSTVVDYSSRIPEDLSNIAVYNALQFLRLQDHLNDVLGKSCHSLWAMSPTEYNTCRSAVAAAGTYVVQYNINYD